MNKYIICLILIFSIPRVFAWPPTYGPEFILTNDYILAHSKGKKQLDADPAASLERAAQVKLVDYLRQKCAGGDCKIKEVPGKWDKDFILTFKDGFWIKYSYDPRVVEIMFKPSTIEEMKKNQARIDEYVFDSGKEVELKASRYESGHLNMGINSLFNGNVESFLKFYVDYANRPDLALGTLGYDPSNAPTLAHLKKNQRTALKKIVDDFYKGKLTTVQEAAARIQNEVYTSSYNEAWGGIEHYQAVGLKYVNQTDLTLKDAPMELRGIRGQMNTEEFIKLATLFEKRVEYLNKNVSRIEYNETKRLDFNVHEMKTRFKIYVEESGLNFKDYEPFVSHFYSAQLTPIVIKNADPISRLNDLKGYFDLLSSSTRIQDLFVEILSHPELQNHPLCIAYQKDFEKKSINSKNKELFKNLHQAIESRKLIPAASFQKASSLRAGPSKKVSYCSKLFR